MNKPNQNSIIILYDKEKDKKHILNLATLPEKYSTANGIIAKEKILNTDFGGRIETHLGYEYILLPATLYDFIMKKLNRLTQIVYPKDAAYIILRLDIKPGDVVIESGIGSGAMSAVFAQIVGEQGKLISYEKRQEFIDNALKNLKRFNLLDRIEIKHRDIAEGFDEKDVDAVFIDVKEPWLYLENAIKPLKNGKLIAVLVPTTNQVSVVLKEMERLPLIDIEVSEILQRFWKTNPDRLRPYDTMSAHTAFLIFARKINY
ncbi:tRNA (adenine-N1)-methyltransferase [Hippea maritima]|uniref:tRNA (adenine(58)-N(1))-methyltransferase TrmI n=1 Tax=Hippea maritima (strain ATCC 700847 / DSM 10411 / MH2) TaxID=760142 RepID=F2LUQ7_HIPMA|nr:tRNA (adenine-N1)-methyltransferase [Hippea maritima]AEA33512.1 protein-L-isoaspartate(D-aspartate)O-methyltransferase [Hippea maritima DSM 10411]